jgi:hypothetical protein
MCNAIELKSASQHLFDQLAQGVQQHNRPKRFGCRIRGFSRLRYDDRQRFLKVSRPVASP